jgi:hypothetical protein
MTASLLARPRTRAQARRRRAATLTVVTCAAVAGTLVLAARNLERSDGTCWIIPEADGTWVAVNFDPSSFPPDGCEIGVWRDEP